MSWTYRRALLTTLALLTVPAPAVAQAAVVAGAVPATAASVTIGQAGVASTLTLSNVNTGADAGATNVVCNAGQAAPCLGASERGIELVPSCAIQDELATCATGNADPSVFQVSPVARGRAGSACAGRDFTVTVSDPATGAVRFTPQPAGSAVSLPAGTACVIDFTQAVLRAPTMDARPLEPGIQTRQVLGHGRRQGRPPAAERVRRS